MVRKKAALVGLATIALSIVLALAVTTGTGVGLNGYTVGTVTMTPSSSACIGGALSLSGSGANPGDVISVHLIGVQGVYEAALGTAIVDGAGNWSLGATVPYTVNVAPTAGGGTAATITGTWEVSGFVTTGGNAGVVQIGTIDLINCPVLPKTGSPLLPVGLAMAGLFTAAGIGAGALAYRRRG